MKVYWLKDVKTKKIVGYDKLHYLKDFCLKHNGVELKWQSSPKSYYVLIDINEIHHNEITEFIKNTFHINDFKITTRNNLTAAKAEINSQIYHLDYQPFSMSTNINIEEVIKEVNTRYNTHIKKDDLS